MNIFGMLDENFAFSLAVMVDKFGWTGINVVCGTFGDYRFLDGCCRNLKSDFQRATPSLANLRYQRYDVHPEDISPPEIDIVLAKISDTRGKF
jgi:hypothetical protein